jgi:hypothetical protein
MWKTNLGQQNYNPGVVVSILTFSISLGVYLKTASPSIAGGDSGELVAEGCMLGTAHPPGYPLYIILIYILTKVRFFLRNKIIQTSCGSPAYFVNLMSCVFGALTSGLITKAVYELSLPKVRLNSHVSSGKVQGQDIRLLTSVAVGLLHTFSPLAWQYSVTAEVFALHSFFVALLINLAVYFANARTKKSLFLGAFISGLALTNQHTVILFEVPLILWVLISIKLWNSPRLLLATSFYFLLGLTPYASLPFLAVSWPHEGSWGDVVSFSGFWHHVARRDYGTTQLYSGDDSTAESLIERIQLWIQDFILTQSCHYSFIIFVIYGMIVLSKKDKTTPKEMQIDFRLSELKCTTSNIGIMLIGSLMFYILVFLALANLPLSNKLLYGIHQRFWIHPNIFMFLFAGVGFSDLTAYSKACNHKAAKILLTLLTIYTVTEAYHKNLSISDQSRNTYFCSYARGLLDPLKKKILLFINNDQQWTSIRYVQECEGFRKDVTSINLSMMSYPWWQMKHSLYPSVKFPGTHYTKENTRPWFEGGFTFTELLEDNYDHRPGGIFVGGQLSYKENSYADEYLEIPFGMTRRLVKKSSQTILTAEKFRKYSLVAWGKIAQYYFQSGLPSELKYPEETWEYTINREFCSHMLIRATYLLDLAVSPSVNDSHVLQSLVDAAACSPSKTEVKMDEISAAARAGFCVILRAFDAEINEGDISFLCKVFSTSKGHSNLVRLVNMLSYSRFEICWALTQIASCCGGTNMLLNAGVLTALLSGLASMKTYGDGCH